ncbi:MAG: PH domain-containing protein [Weeksellaceae bacterium]
MMKFHSRVDALNTFVLLGTVLFLIGLCVFSWIDQPGSLTELIWISFMLLVISGFLLWIYLGTSYEITEDELKYKSGPLSGKIKIESIREIDMNKTMWVGIKPATALRGLIVKFNRFDDIYISPKDNEIFVAEILKRNPKIKINRF